MTYDDGSTEKLVGYKFTLLRCEFRLFCLLVEIFNIKLKNADQVVISDRIPDRFHAIKREVAQS